MEGIPVLPLNQSRRADKPQPKDKLPGVRIFVPCPHNPQARNSLAVPGLPHCGALASVGALRRLDHCSAWGGGCRGELAREMGVSENKAGWTCGRILRVKWIKEFPERWSWACSARGPGTGPSHTPSATGSMHAGQSPRHLCLSLGWQNWLYRIACQPDPRHRLPQGLSLYQRP